MINTIRNNPPTLIVAGAHRHIIQSILDFDYVAGRETPSITTVIDGGRTAHKCAFGPNEILLPSYPTITEANATGINASLLLNLASGNSARKVTETFFNTYPDALGAHLFAEGVREFDAVALATKYPNKRIAGASGVGLLIPGSVKLGAIGGIFGGNINTLASTLGNTAVICSSGGMVNEIIDTLLRSGGAPSFAVSYGGERFPITTPLSWCLEAENDPSTNSIVYFGELGGFDEYEIANALKAKQITKSFHVYIAGHYVTDDIQFGHAKALAKTPSESAEAKQTALRTAGAHIYETFDDFYQALTKLPHQTKDNPKKRDWQAPATPRRYSLFTAVQDRGNSSDSFVRHALCTLLEKDTVSDVLTNFTEQAYSCLIDHGAEPSGAVNTMITARAGRDLPSALATGILTIGDRFGGAINNSARVWHDAVSSGTEVETLLEDFKKRSQYLPGIGHKKYTLYRPDPRVHTLTTFAKENLTSPNHLTFAEAVAKRTTEKKPNLILNIDGAIASIVLDILIEHEHFSESDIRTLLETEFMNSFFIIPRTVGFIGHFLSQKRRDEGLFRLPEDEVFYL